MALNLEAHSSSLWYSTPARRSALHGAWGPAKRVMGSGSEGAEDAWGQQNSVGMDTGRAWSEVALIVSGGQEDRATQANVRVAMGMTAQERHPALQ